MLVLLPWDCYVNISPDETKRTVGSAANVVYVFIPTQESSLTGNWTFRSQDHSLLGAKVPGVFLRGTFAPWNFRSHQ